MKTISLRFRTTLFSLLASTGLIGHPPSASALAIDDFTQGPLASVQGTNTAQFGTTVVQTGLNPSLVLGGTRSVFVGSLSLATVSIEPNKGRFHFSADNNFGYFKLDWGSVAPLNANLSAGGNNRFQIEFVDVMSNATLNLFTLRVKSGNTWFNYEIGNDLASALHGGTFGTLSIPFTKFGGANLAEVGTLGRGAAGLWRRPGFEGAAQGGEKLRQLVSLSSRRMGGASVVFRTAGSNRHRVLA